MRLLVICVLLLAFAPSVSGALPDIDFQTPAELSGRIDGSGQWVMLVIDGGSGIGELGAADFTNITRTIAEVDAAPASHLSLSGIPPDLRDPWHADSRSMAWTYGTKGLGHLLVRAKVVSIRFAGEAALDVPGEWVSQALDYPAYPDYENQKFGLASVARTQHAMNVSLGFDGLQYMQWSHASVTCAGPDRCPTGGGRSLLPDPTGRGLFGSLHIEAANADGGAGRFQVHAVAMAMAGTLSLQVEGHARLPLARSPGTTLTNRTLTLDGQFGLESVQPAGSHAMSARVSAEGARALLDEGQATTLFDRALGFEVTATVAVGIGGVLVWKLLWTLAIRQPLASPRRKAIMDYVSSHPGATFNDLARDLQVHRGNLGRHLLVLRKANLVVEHALANSKRWFENHGKYDNTWRETALLRDPTNAMLHRIIGDHHGVTQREMERIARDHGIARSTLRYRLSQLERDGLVRRLGDKRAAKWFVA